MKIPDFIRANVLLKMTSLNAAVITVRLIVSLFIQRLLAEIVGEAGISKIGQLRNLTQILTSISSVGIFNGIVKYVSEYKEDKEQLKRLFSTAFLLVVIGVIVSGTLLFFGADGISNYLFSSTDFSYLIKLVAVIVPFIGIQRVFNGVVNGLSMYKKFAKIDLFAYLLSAILTVILLLNYNIEGALIAIALTPVIQLTVLLIIFFSVLKEYVHFKKISMKAPMGKSLLAFTLMSFVSTVLLNYVEIDIRTMIVNRITEEDAGIWTAMTFISKNYMVFSGAIFTLYVLPKFASIHTRSGFNRELLNIYKTLLPIFGVGMILVYLFRNLVIDIIYPDFTAMAPLFKWQLMGDFVRLASVVLAHQFLAKKLVRNFIFTEILSLALFYGLARYFTTTHGVEGVVIAHFIRYIIYFFVVFFLVFRYFKKQVPST
ncbi:MAG: O-antigen translocase [Bacteroidia bacterium]|nr:O-antigen translocase [Bacteroidia bacterium]NNF32283.1 O-antigen translocase [Flavobacteriaceae bacterium]MBT8276925.1 O-antigen translocase [Bacteroidia bacterium]NNJ83294.1 O-antigen translocase [Flavobacteriaceae bacterium]NNK53758.1 O-antigen translocase [Flavobacteriaceae bacterium]